MKNENENEEAQTQEAEMDTQEINTDTDTAIEDVATNETEESMEAFKPDAFITEEETEEGEKEEQEEKKPEDTESEDDSFVWDIGGDDEESEDELDKSPTSETEPTQENNSGQEQVLANDTFDNSVFDEFKKVGINAKDTNELLGQVKQLIEDNVSYQTKYVTNDKIDFWKKTLSLNNKELVKKILTSEGFEGEKLDQAIETYENNGTLEIEATRYRNNIRNRIKAEVDNEGHKAKSDEAKQSQAQQEARNQLNEHLNKSDTMFGFKMSKDKQSLPKVREGHFEYIDSGKFMNGVLKDSQSISEAAWFQRHKETIIKALQNKGRQAGKQEILNDIHEATTDNTERILSPNDNSNEFNPTKFTNID